MPFTTEAEFVKALKDAGLYDAFTKASWPWGVRIEEFDGVKKLVAITPDEYRESAERALGRKLSDAEVKTPSCTWVGTGCVSNGCTAANGTCRYYYDRYGWHCVCDY